MKLKLDFLKLTIVNSIKLKIIKINITALMTLIKPEYKNKLNLNI